MSNLSCSKCGSEVAADATFCASCGSQLASGGGHRRPSPQSTAPSPESSPAEAADDGNSSESERVESDAEDSPLSEFLAWALRIGVVAAILCCIGTVRSCVCGSCGGPPDCVELEFDCMDYCDQEYYPGGADYSKCMYNCDKRVRECYEERAEYR